MLEAIRKRTASIFVKGLLGLLVVSFAIWGIGDVFRGGSRTSMVAQVGDVEIRPDQFNKEFQREMNRLRAVFGGELDLERARALGLADSVLGRMINDILFVQGANALGVAISDDLVSGEIRNTRAFRDSRGTFDRARFEQALQSNRLSEDGYVALVRGDLTRAHFLGSVQAGAAAPRTLVTAMYNRRQEKRIADVLRVADGAMTGIPEPDAETLAAFHKDKAGRFTAPEYRALTVVTLTAEDLAKEIAISDEALREAFEDREDEFDRPERRRLQMMVLDDEDAARRAYGMLGEGRDFAAVAKEVANADAETLDLGWVTRDQLLPELADAVFSLQEGGYGEPVKSPLGWHLLRLVDVEAARRQTLDDVRQALTAELARDRAIDGLVNLANRLEDELGGGATLEDAASQLNLKLTKVPAIDRGGRGAGGDPVRDLPPGTQFLATAFQTAEGTESLLSEAGTDAYFIVRVDSIMAPALRPLDSIRAEVTRAWKAERRAEKAKETAEGILARLRDGVELAAVAAEMGLGIKTTEPFTRSSGGAASGLPNALVRGLFEIRPAEATMARAADGYDVARLKEVRAADPFADKDGLEALRAQITDSMRSDLLVQLADALRKRYPVSVNRQVFDNLF